MFSLIKYTRITYEDYVYPPWGEAVGWLITVASMLCVPLLVIKTIVDIYWRGNDGGNTSQVVVRCKSKSKRVLQGFVDVTEVDNTHRRTQRFLVKTNMNYLPTYQEKN